MEMYYGKKDRRTIDNHDKSGCARFRCVALPLLFILPLNVGLQTNLIRNWLLLLLVKLVLHK